MHHPSSARPWQSIAIALLLVTVLLAAVLVIARPVAAATYYVQGHLSVSQTWTTGNTYVLVGNVTVDNGVVLTIQPGVTVLGNTSVVLYVNGGLQANGNASSPISFAASNITLRWGGIQFNDTAQGAVTWSALSDADTAVIISGSAPSIANVTITRVTTGIRATNDPSLGIVDSIINHATFGIDLTGCDGQILRNSINDAVFAIHAQTLGSLVISNNEITNVSAAVAAPALPSIGIYANGITSVTVSNNSISDVTGAPGTKPGTAAADGTAGSSAFGVLVNATGFITVNDNQLDWIEGGVGGDGNGGTLTAGQGGAGGMAAGVVVLGSQSLALQGNVVSNLTGGAGGAGGSAATGNGGAGGMGGAAAGLDIYSVTPSAAWMGNRVSSVVGGSGGAGGGGLLIYGHGGTGGDGYGILFARNPGAQPASNAIQSIQGGTGGSSNPSGPLGGSGGAGGQAYGIAVLGADGVTTLRANRLTSLQGGAGGSGRQAGGTGGNATAVLVLGDGTPFNLTSATSDQITSVIGGLGGTGYNVGGAGGGSLGLIFAHVMTASANNTIAQITGGGGGSAYKGYPAGQPGQAGGLGVFLVPAGNSTGDIIRGVRNGTVGVGTSPPPAFGVGFYFLGNQTITSALVVTNDTVSGTSSYDLYVDNYTHVTTVDTPFDASKVTVEAAGNLTVCNFLSLRILWPNNVTYVPGASVVVKDNSATAWVGTAPTGQLNWILLTNRVYVDRSTPTYNATTVNVTYSGYSFLNDPRSVNMSASHTEYFTMNDTFPPSSNAYGLPTYETTRTFYVPYNATDGYGRGVYNVSLWYRTSGIGWSWFTEQAGVGSGRFAFTANSDGVFEFVTIAVDLAGNVQPFPTTNNTWTIVDTTAPTSLVEPLPRYETSLTFAVHWVAGAGVTDIKNYTIQVNSGGGWTTWLANSTLTFGLYTAAGQGTYAFRSIARDCAGNTESKTVNDTWTIVDTIAPQIVSVSPTGNVSVSTPLIVITFSKPMNATSVLAAFSVSPFLGGNFTWSNGFTTLSFQPSQSLQPGTQYTVSIGPQASDVAGNPIGRIETFTFTSPAGHSSGFSLLDLWPLFLALAVLLAVIAFFLLRRWGTTNPEAATDAPKPAAVSSAQEAAIDDVFLLYRKDGILIKHETRRLRPDVDTDILSGMLTAVQQFVKDSFRGEEDEELNEMTVGEMHILIGRGKWLILAATITGGDIQSMTTQIRKTVQDMEDHHWDELEDWDGDMSLAKALGPYLKNLIRGEYA